MLYGKEWIEDLYERLKFLSKPLEGSGRIDEQDYPDAYRTILDAIALCAEIMKSPNADEANEGGMMKPVVFSDHPDHGWKWTDLELRWIAERDEQWKERIAQLERELAECKEFKIAVENELILCGILNDSHKDAKKAIQDAIQWNVDAALDPAVSSVASAWKEERDSLATQVLQMKDALHSISLCEFNSMSSRQEMGRLSRAALAIDTTPAEQIIAKVKAEAYEECATICDELEQHGFHFVTYDGWDEVPAEACHCAAAIRKRSNANRMADELEKKQCQ